MAMLVITRWYWCVNILDVKGQHTQSANQPINCQKNDHHKSNHLPRKTQYIYIYLVGGLTILNLLKNDGVRQWEGWHPIYEMENKSHVPNHQPVYINK